MERFSATLPEFHSRYIVFWNDESGEFSEQVNELTISGVTIVKLTGRNNFSVKKLLTSNDLIGNYLIYNPITYENPQDNWLLDIELFSGEPFLAYLVSMQMEELTRHALTAVRFFWSGFVGSICACPCSPALLPINSYHIFLKNNTGSLKRIDF